MDALNVRKNWKHWGKPPAIVFPARNIDGTFAGIPAYEPAISRTKHSTHHIIGHKIKEMKGGRA